MTQVIVPRRIAAPVDVVFRAITDISNLPRTNPDSNFVILPGI